MSRQFELQLAIQGAVNPVIKMYGDSRVLQADKRIILTGLEGWDAPPYMSRITVADPNGGTYVDPHGRLESKIVTVTWSITLQDDYASWQVMKEISTLCKTENFLTLTLITVFDGVHKVTEVLDNCYFSMAPTLENKVGEQKYVMVITSKDSDFTSVTEETLSGGDAGGGGETEPQPGEEGYLGKTDGEVGVGLQEGYTWDADLQAWIQTSTGGGGEPVGGPYNAAYSDNPNDPRNFNGPDYNPLYDPNNPDSTVYHPGYTFGQELVGGPHNGKYTLAKRDPRNWTTPKYNQFQDPNNPDANNRPYDPDYVWVPDLFGGPFNWFYSDRPHWYPENSTESQWRDPRNFNHPDYNPEYDPNNPNGYYSDTSVYPDIRDYIYFL
jgi:hypothetical protein